MFSVSTIVLLGLFMTAQAEAPSSGLYFTLNGILYLPGDTVIITDIGVFNSTDAGSSLVCVTSNVNPRCCRGSDGGRVGGWYFPNGTRVPSNGNAPTADFTRNRFTHQVRLNRRNNARSPTGIYECRVPDGDTGELVTANVTLITDQFTPRRPMYVRKTSITSTSVTIQWMLTDPYNPLRPETFIVSYGVTSGHLNMSTPGVTANPTSRTYSTQLNSLQPATVYFYRVESRNTVSTVFSQLLSFETIESTSSQVTDLQRRTANDTALVISWGPPANPNGEILSYSVSIINLSDGSTVRRENTVSTSTTQINLVPGVPYNVSIAAINRAGLGEFSVFLHFTRELEPSNSPENVTVTWPSATVMVVSWIPLSYPEARGFISHYIVAYSPLTSGRKRQQALDTMTQTVPGMDTNTTRIESLDAGTDYIVRVSATNGAGSSGLSSLVLAAAVENSATVITGVACGGAHGAVIGIVVVVVVIVLLVGTAVGVVILILALKLRKYQHADISNQDHEDEVYYSALRAPLTNAEEGMGFTLSKCSAYGPVSAPAHRGESNEDQPAEHEVKTTSHI